MKKLSIKDVIRILETASIVGNEKDTPEGTGYIQISLTLAKKMVECLEKTEGVYKK
jgi:hypothetical protein